MNWPWEKTAAPIASAEVRHNPAENPAVPLTAAHFAQIFGLSLDDMSPVSLDRAYSVPAFTATVTFLAESLANLPLHAFKDRPSKGAERIKGGIQALLNESPNPEWTSFGWRTYHWTQVFTGGRGVSWIERDIRGEPIAIWPMEPAKTTIKRVGGKKVYQFRGKADPYPAADVIDTPFLLKPDQLGSYAPLSMASDVLNLAIAMRKYGAGFFAGGGVPPLALEGPLPQGADALNRAMADVHRVIEAARTSGKPIFPMPPGHSLKAVGLDPEKGQMTEAMRFVNEELGRIWNMPPVFIGDLTHGTFTNTEQQDLQFVKHHLSRRAKAFEEELNLKLFRSGRGARRFVEHNLDGVMRGDLLTRMDALGKAVNSALLMPDEARALDNRPAAPGGDRLYIQGATVPLEQAAKGLAAPKQGDQV